MSFTTPDLCDALGDAVRVAEPVFRDYGGVHAFAGPVETLRVDGDNALVRTTLEMPGGGRVLVIDGGGSVRTALVGGKIADLAASNGWSGIVVYGAVRDLSELAAARVGIKALAPCPRRSAKAGAGERSVRLHIAGISIEPGNHLWADLDGLVVADRSPD